MTRFECHIYIPVAPAREVLFELFVRAKNITDAERAIKHMYQLDDSATIYVWEVEQ